ncbi:MAG: antitoxin Xre/MbcA/ParS toxin-binding domain-containing protein [Gammaproteobacteria bacterium]
MQKLTIMLMRLFELWELDQATKLNFLGLSIKSRSSLTHYMKGKSLPKSRDMLDRAGYLLSIHKALRLLYPKNVVIRHTWIKRRNQAFNNFSPLELIQEEGMLGLAKVARHLDFIRGH